MQQKLGILAGGGALPRILIDEARKNGVKAYVCGFHGHTDQETLDMADAFEHIHIGQFAKAIKFFTANNISEVCLAGAINKPKVTDIRPDLLAAKLLFTLKDKGDDALLKGVMNLLESEGLHIVSAAKLLPSLLAPEGILTKKQPDTYIKENKEYALGIMQTLGTLDIGQSLVVNNQMVVAVECIEGTDATIQRGGNLLKGRKTPNILVKLLKEGQDERADLPSVGLKTIENLIESGYVALIIEADKTLFFDREKAVNFADAHKFIIWSIRK